VAAPFQEVPYFHLSHYDQDICDKIENCFRQEGWSGREKVRGIKRPDYLGTPGVAENIHRHCPDVNLIAVLRNPADRFVSAYYHYMRVGLLPVVRLNNSYERILSGEYEKEYPIARRLIEYGLYAKHLSDYIELFGKDRVLVFFHEDIRRAPHQALRELEQVFDLPSFDYTKIDHVQPMQGRYNLFRIRLLRLAAKRDSNDFISTCLHSLDHHLLERALPNRPDRSEGVIHALRQFYVGDVNHLEALTKRDLGQWKP